METRKITIANTRDQKKSVVMSAATNLGELKRDLDAAGINYSDMEFIEALTKTQLKDDSSPLPHDVPYNHTTTNELVFLLTIPNRKIKSGGNRDEVYKFINNAPDSFELKEAIKNHFGRNYTMVTTMDLEDFVEDWKHLRHNNEQCTCCQREMTLEERVEMLEHKVSNLHEAMMNVIDVLDSDYFTEDIQDALAKGATPKDNTVYSAGMSSDEIDELVKDL